jgi:Ca-activated chloride channel family protein
LLLGVSLLTGAPLLLAQNKVPVAIASDSDCDPRIVVNTDLISLTVAVTDSHGQHVPGLKQESFHVYDDQVGQEISFFSGEDGPVSVGIVFDLSGSMSGHKTELAREALARFMDSSHVDDEFFLVGFDTESRILSRSSQESRVLLEQITGIEAQGNTALYDAVSRALDTLGSARYSRRAIIVISDGEDNRSRLAFSQLHRRLVEANVTVFAVHVGAVLPGKGGRAILARMASITGGSSFFPINGEAMSAAFDRISLELRHQYSIGYVPSNFLSDGKLHRITVKVSPSEPGRRFVVHTREAYIAAQDLTQRR